MFTDPGRDRLALLLRVARMYWEDDLDQKAIADRLGYSRPTVSRMLAEARREGIVTVTVAHPVERLIDLEGRLVTAFGLKEARVSPTEPLPGSTTAVGPSCARAAADLLLSHCDDRSVIAVSNGRSVGAAVHHMPDRAWPGSTAVAMLGSAGGSFELEDGPDICRNMALHLGGNYRSMPVPLVFGSASNTRAVLTEEQVVTTLELASRSDAALTGIGSFGAGDGSLLLKRWLTPAVEEEYRDKDVVAHLCGHPLDAEGNHVHTSICDRMVCLEPERLRRIPAVIGVAVGEEKAVAIAAALRGHFLTGLATDEATAEKVLALA